MSQWLNHALYGWYPYVALTTCLLGSLLRFDHGQYTWRTGSSQLLRRKQMLWGSNLFHVGILIVLGGHVVGLLTPVAAFDALGIAHSFKQALAMTVGGIAGILCWIGIALLAHRRLFDPRIRATSSAADIAILLLLWAQLTLGLMSIPVSAQHMDGHEMVKFMNWAQGIATLQPGASELIADVNPIFKLHILLGLTIVLVVPFTRLVHVWSAPVWYLGRPGYQVVRTRRRLTRPAAAAVAAGAARVGVVTPVRDTAVGDD